LPKESKSKDEKDNSDLEKMYKEQLETNNSLQEKINKLGIQLKEELSMKASYEDKITNLNKLNAKIF